MNSENEKIVTLPAIDMVATGKNIIRLPYIMQCYFHVISKLRY